MRTTTTLITGLLLAVFATTAAAGKPPPCTGGRFIVTNPPDEPLFREEGGTGLHVLTLSQYRQSRKLVLSLPDGSSAKGTRKFTIPARGLAFQFGRSCDELAGTLTVSVGASSSTFVRRRDQTRVVKFTARRSACGDTIVDPVLHEECESNIECGARSACNAACACVPDPHGTPTTTTTTTIPDDDLDDDCIPNDREAVLGTRADDWDTDGDGIRDGDEDPDDDGLGSCTELVVLGTDPGAWDTDGDADDDGSEVAIHTDPRDPESQPLYPAEVLHQGLEYGTDTDLLAFTLQSSRRIYLRVADTEHREAL
ncbi:MAG TPA: hypothetical protein VGR62_18160, partial [Candidatus Binatia bacterium]|nr:hypothetical protein [Candidatus Binatia bacterium]